MRSTKHNTHRVARLAPRAQVRYSSVPCAANIAQAELSNGLRVFAYENFASPSVVVRGYLVAGACDEAPAGPPGSPEVDAGANHAGVNRAGLAAFVADCLMRGAGSLSYEQIFQQIESIGAHLDVSGGMHTTGFYAKSLVEDLPFMVDLLSTVLIHPTFPSEEIERERGEWLTTLQERANSASAMAGLIFNELCYPAGHPYRYSIEGYPETARALTRDDLVAFHRTYFSPQDMVIVIVGAVKAEDAHALVERAFGAWRANRPARPPLPAAPKLQASIRRHHAMPGKAQTSLMVGHPGPSRRDPDWIKLALMNSILGQFGMYGRLGQRVRKERGLVYAIGSYLEGGLGPGPWHISAGVHPDLVDRVIEICLAEMRRLRERKVRPQELQDNQFYFIGSLPLRMETNDGIAGQIVHMARYELGLDYLLHYPDRVRAVTPADIQAVACTWLDPDHVAVATAGP
ncbi:MAG: pitrilysin family protein [Anaerolineae bacterium]|nr:insulinase family protein [Thermoflexales bacterium]MDW8406835.1 pitrilysin family protein [Anaerolineae bacterium]